MSAERILSLKNLKLTFRTGRGQVRAVDGVDLDLTKGRSMVIIGESGCGKSSLIRAILRMLPRNVHTYSGEAILAGEDVMKLSDDKFRSQIRWIKMALVPQAAMNALNPVIRVDEQVLEPLMVHKKVKTKAEALVATEDVFRKVGVPLDFLSRYPFELSGGMRQRVAIAMSLVTSPQLVVLDEPTSALDVLTQAAIMNVLKKIKREYMMSFILITHDIAISSEIADDVAVMYAGKIIEVASADTFYSNPKHPYSQKLMASVPTLRETKELQFIPGQPPSLLDPPEGCRFYERCTKRKEECKQEPPLCKLEDGRQVRCWLYK